MAIKTMDELRRLVRRGDFGRQGVRWYHSRGYISDEERDELLDLVDKYEEVRARRDYSWMTPEWVVQAERCERLVKPAITRRRWTDKDDIVTDYVVKHDWPIIPTGVGAHFEGERALRIFFGITDGPEAHKALDEAILFARISGEDADRVWLTSKDRFLVVPARFFIWVAGALSFDKRVLLSLPADIMEHRLKHADCEIWPDLVWISPIKKEDREQYYAIMPLPGLPGVIDPKRGNPSLYRPLQKRLGWDPYRNIIWQVVDEIVDKGVSSWGEGAASGDGALSIFLIKQLLVNFIRDYADTFVEEEFARMVRRGEFERSSISRAISNGLFKHLPDDQREARENHWLEAADLVGRARAARAARAFRVYSLGGAASAILHGTGEGWADDPQIEANRMVEIAWLCSRGNFLARIARIQFIREDWGGAVAEEAEKAYLAGDISPRELSVDTSSDRRTEFNADEGIVDQMLQEFKPELDYLTSEEYPK